MKKLLILSGKGGTGKTTIAGAFAKLLNAKYIVDCDVEAPNLDLLFADIPMQKEKPYYSLPVARIDPETCIGCGKCQETCRFEAISAIDGKYQVDMRACEGCKACTLVCPVNAISMETYIGGTIYRSLGEPTIISAKLKPGTGSSGLLVTEVKKLLEPFQNENEYAVIDGPPGIGCPVIASLKNVDFALIVTEPSLSGLSDLKRVITMARQFKAPMAIIINKHDLHEGITKQIEVFAVSEHIPLIGKIPYDEKAILMLNRGMTIDQTTSEMSFVIKELLRKTVELMD